MGHKARALWPLGRTAEQSALVEEAMAAARHAGDPLVLSQVLTMSSDRAWATRELDVARAHADEALEYATQAGDDWWIAMAWFGRAMAATTVADLRELGLVELFSGNTATARDAFREELRLSRELVVLPFAHEGLMGLAAVATTDADDDRAARLRGASEGLRSDPVDPVHERLATQFFEPARERHGADAWDAAEREGRALSFADAIAYGLEEPRA